MIGCKTPEDFDSAIEHGTLINNTHPDQTQDDSLQFLDTTQKEVSKIEGKYQTKNKKAQIKQSTTEKVSKQVPYKGKENDLLDQQSEIGQFIHELNQVVAQEVIDQIESMSNDSALKFVRSYVFPTEGLKKMFTKYGKTLDTKSQQNLLEGVRQNLVSILKQQRVINTLTNTDGKVKFRLEQVVIDPKNGIGGTIDFLAIFSNNTATILDYKTKFVGAYNLDEDGNIISMDKIAGKDTLKRYQLQLGEYGRILRQSYGIKKINKSAVIPIKIQVTLNKATNTYGNKITNLAYPGQDPKLEEILPFSSTTNFKQLDDYIRGIDEQIIKLEERIKKSPSRREELEEKIKALNAGRKDLLTKHNLDTILDYAKSLSKQVEKAELGDLSIPELQELIEELQLLSSLSTSTFEYRKFLKNTSKKDEVERIEQKIGVIISELNDTIETLQDSLFKDKVTKLIELHTGYKITDDVGNFLPQMQEGYFGKWFYQLSQYDNPVFQTLRKILDEINYSVRQKTDMVVEDIVRVENKVYSWLKNSGRTFDDLVKIMIDPNKDNLWGKYSDKFFEKVNSATPNELPQYYEPSETYDEWYQSKLLDIVQMYKDQETSPAELESNINGWISKNDLSLENGLPVYPEAWVKAKNFHTLRLKDSPKDYNENYKFILSIPELKEYYEMFEKYNKEFRKTLGVQYSNLPNNFLPNIRKVMSERVTDQGFNGFLSGTADFLKDFSIREDDRSDDSTYNSNDKIPIFFLNPFKNNDGSLQVGEKSYQMGRSLAIFAKMAYNYEATTNREAEILALQQFLDTSAEQIQQSRGKNLIDKMGNPLTEKLQATDLPEIFRSFVDMYIYKVGIKPIIGDKSGLREKQLMKAKEYFTLKALGFNVIAGLGSLMSAKINTLVESNKGIIFNKTNYKESMTASWTDREKFLAINAYFDPMSHRLNNPRLAEENKYGERFYSDPTMRGWINKYINSRMLMNTFSIGDQYIEELILAAMSKNYYVDELGNLKRIKNEADLELHKDRLIWNLFSYSKEDGAKLNLTEAQMMNAFESFRRAVQAGQSRVKGTISEEDKAHWQNNIVMQLVMHFKSWMPGILFERFGKVKFDNRIDSIYMGKYTSLAQEFGGMDKMVFSDVMKKILLPKMGRLLGDVVTLGLFSKSRLNDKLNKQLYFERWLDENPHHKGKVSFEEFNEVQQKQLKSVIQELRVLLLLAGLLVLLVGGGDDDDKFYKRYLLTRKLASLMFKVQSELSFVYSPVQFSNMIKNPIPLLGLVNDAQKVITNTFDELLLDPIFGEERLLFGGTKKDNTPFGSQSIKALPGSAGVIRFFDFMNQDIQYSKDQQ